MQPVAEGPWAENIKDRAVIFKGLLLFPYRLYTAEISVFNETVHDLCYYERSMGPLISP